jgi:hypothetical protein
VALHHRTKVAQEFRHIEEYTDRVAGGNKFEEIDEQQSSNTSHTITTERTRDETEELLWKQKADHRPRRPRDHRHQAQAGPGTNPRSRRVTRTLNTAPTAPEIIAAKTKYAKS